jgi:magnesium chelatase family protein
VVAARRRQAERYADSGVSTNASLSPSALRKHGVLDRAAARLLRTAAQRLSLSARAYDRVRKVARTIADLAGEEQIGGDHVAEALQFRISA